VKTVQQTQTSRHYASNRKRRKKENGGKYAGLYTNQHAQPSFADLTTEGLLEKLKKFSRSVRL
jgi:uncharacterized protein (DUF2225 family)